MFFKFRWKRVDRSVVANWNRRIDNWTRGGSDDRRNSNGRHLEPDGRRGELTHSPACGCGRIQEQRRRQLVQQQQQQQNTYRPFHLCKVNFLWISTFKRVTHSFVENRAILTSGWKNPMVRPFSLYHHRRDHQDAAGIPLQFEKQKNSSKILPTDPWTKRRASGTVRIDANTPAAAEVAADEECCVRDSQFGIHLNPISNWSTTSALSFNRAPT